MKQTAVQWLRKELETIPNYSTFYTNNYQWIDSIMNEAKAMEKEQIVTTWNTAHQAGRFEGKGIAEENWQTFESYWNETFKQQ